MEYRPLKLTIESAKDIKNLNTFSKQDAYAVVSLVGYPNSKQKTPVHTDCGTKPEWNHDMEFVVDEPLLTKPGLSLLVEIFNECAFRSDKLIGSVTLPVDELYGSNSSDEQKTFKYQVLTDGKPKGELKLSYKFGEKFAQGGGEEKQKEVKDQPLPAYPAPTEHLVPVAHPGTEYPPQYAPPPPPPQAGYGGYPPQYAPPPQAGYGGYPQQYAPPPQAGYGGYPPQAGGYGQQYPPQPGYGYPPAGYAAYPSGGKPNKSGMGTGAAVGLGVGAGLVGGLLVADAMDDFGDDGGDMGDF